MSVRDGAIRSFGRIRGRTLKPRQAALIDTLLQHLSVPEEGLIDLDELFCEISKGPAILEIGFGGGEHVVAQASAHPDARFIGVEPFVNGVASCLRHIEESGVQNVRLHQGDARDVIARLPDASLDLVYILFPDPWPKARHHKRRLIQPAFLGELARVMKTGAEVRFATDWANYAEWTLEHFTNDARFAPVEGTRDEAWPGHVTTRYEAKKLGDCAPVWMRFARA